MPVNPQTPSARNSNSASTSNELPLPLGRRELLATAVASGSIMLGAALSFGQEKPAKGPKDDDRLDGKKGAGIRYGLVTYQWGKDWDLLTLIKNCAVAGVGGIELRTTHKHGVEPTLTEDQRSEVKNRFDDSPVRCVGIGSDERFDNPDPAVVAKAIEKTKQFVVLSHDIGGTGVKVKPDRFWPDVPHEKTIEQIGKSLNELGEYGEGFGQQIRLEVHGQCAELPTIKAILEVANHRNVGICWNCNPTDLQGAGLEANFNLVKNRLGETVHIHLVDSTTYPHAELFKLLVQVDYVGWLMLEEGKIPADPASELGVQRKLFDEMISTARQKFG